MFGIGTFPDDGALRPGVVWMSGSFATNGANDPSTSSFLGSLKGRFTVSHAGTGLYTVTLGTGLVFPEAPIIEATNSVANTGAVWCAIVTYPSSSAWQNSARQFQISTANQSAPNTPADIAADNRNRITFYIEAINSTGK